MCSALNFTREISQVSMLVNKESDWLQAPTHWLNCLFQHQVCIISSWRLNRILWWAHVGYKLVNKSGGKCKPSSWHKLHLWAINTKLCPPLPYGSNTCLSHFTVCLNDAFCLVDFISLVWSQTSCESCFSFGRAKCFSLPLPLKCLRKCNSQHSGHSVPLSHTNMTSYI